MPNHLPPNYDAHLNVLFDKTKHELPEDLQTETYRDHIFKPQRWLREALLLHGFSEDLATGIQVGMTDWLVNLVNLGNTAPMSTFEYVKTFMLGMLNDQTEPIKPQEPESQDSDHMSIGGSGSFTADSIVIAAAVVLNERMKTDDMRHLVFAPGVDPDSLISDHMDDDTFLGVGWFVGEHDRFGIPTGLYWLDNGDTCWANEVVTALTSNLMEGIWRTFAENASRTTILDLRHKTLDGVNLGQSATGQTNTQ